MRPPCSVCAGNDRDRADCAHCGGSGTEPMTVPMDITTTDIPRRQGARNFALALAELVERMLEFLRRDPKFRRIVRKQKAADRKAQIIEERAMRRIVRQFDRPVPPLLHKGKAPR